MTDHFSITGESAAPGGQVARVLRRVGAFVLALGSGVLTFVVAGYAGVAAALSCDDFCSTAGVDWYETRDAWQRDLGVLAFRRQTAGVLQLMSACAALVAGALGVVALVFALSFHW